MNDKLVDGPNDRKTLAAHRLVCLFVVGAVLSKHAVDGTPCGEEQAE